jgi:hypothetical protein
MQRPINGFKKGQSGNPKGRPKGIKTIPEMLREIGDRPVDDVLLAKLHSLYGPAHNPKTLHEAMLMAATKDAAKGDKDAREFIANRTEGKVTDKLILDDQTPREVIFKEERLGSYSATTPVAVVRTIIRDKPNV